MNGYNIHRHNSNPKEKEIHDLFVKRFGTPVTMSLIVNGAYPLEQLSLKEMKITISAMQWLGSPVGQSFLRECGFELKQD